MASRLGNRVLGRIIFRQASTQPNKTKNPPTPQTLTPDLIEKVIENAPQLRQYDHHLWQRTYDALSDQGFSSHNFVNIISAQPSLLTRQQENLLQTIECWRSTQFGDQRVLDLLVQYPELFHLNDSRLILHRTSYLKTYAGTLKNIWRIFMNAPNVVTEREELVETKIQYFERTMRVEVSDVVKSTAFARNMDVIQTRHVFLDRLGLFKPRSPKANAKDPNKNPRMHQIYDTSDKDFATKIGGVTVEEFEMFEKLFGDELDRGARAERIEDE